MLDKAICKACKKSWSVTDEMAWSKCGTVFCPTRDLWTAEVDGPPPPKCRHARKQKASSDAKQRDM